MNPTRIILCHSRETCPRPDRGAGIYPWQARRLSYGDYGFDESNPYGGITQVKQGFRQILFWLYQ